MTITARPPSGRRCARPAEWITATVVSRGGLEHGWGVGRAP